MNIILRIDCRSGLHLEFNYLTSEEAEEFRQKLLRPADAKPVHVFDQNGRDSFIKPAEVIHVMVSDLELEQAAMARTSLECQRIQGAAAQAYKRQPQVVQGRVAVLGPNGAPVGLAPRSN